MSRSPSPLLLAALLAGCAETPHVVRAPPPPAHVAVPAMGLDRVMGKDAAALTAAFGPPALDVKEGPARKLQFRGPACTLDAYLYPPQGAPTGAARVTWLDARTPAGQDFDRASCIAALVRR